MPGTHAPTSSVFDMDLMLALLADLPEQDLNALEDDLDFYHFAGVLSERLQRLLARAEVRRVA